MITPAYAQTAADGGQGLFSALLPFLLIIVVFYFLLIRPQQKRVREHQQMVASLRKGDHVITSGGIAGKIVKAGEGSETVDVEIASGVTVSVVRSSVSELRNQGNNPASAVKNSPATRNKK